ncbi:3-deoxy-7-phosphoheptulonate synthase class II [Desulfobacter hydrogenophilus]|uniref:Phospho-2-dehydro-3-deoxyheptonate aldolase n=1 Tax=Desulfobacter hydrogenophilus TaxID=2291 RepID=A0A328FI86_9BACT|nr:3-deoxy-7-phosphoheptulonate synthase class II [Desulfobacter hydrogenophilus]NDY70649.1 3-deoxy-7-phosphoheptulonate synthase class II [Desulfobacter hydrogenophilus]QBH14012.1 3-deoxy-7-phosphoheptulonate synthase class II [Desulfobacter hydrogenophilus]RAM03570.1 3-deoxy-7-phosphoheptulonate synthase class II [Desulfobacter hydrogenophilus]
MTSQNGWTKSSWKNYTALQQPNWPDQNELDKVTKDLALLPPLVFAGEIRTLTDLLAKASKGEAFLIQGGDCSEDFSQVTAPTIRETMKVLLQMAVVMAYAGGKPAIKVGRIAGQFAKPRSSDTEIVDGVELPSYRGDMVNKNEFSMKARTPNPKYMLKGYYLAASTLNLLRAFTRGGYAALHRVQAWNQEFVAQSPMGRSYDRLAKQIDQAMRFMNTIGIPTDIPQINQTQIFTSHEALLLPYEEALTRIDSTTGDWYNCSAHMLWIGERTRQVDGAHVQFLKGVLNPIGVKIGPDHDIDNIKQLIEILNPENKPGRLTLITRMGCANIEKKLPALLREIKREGSHIVWNCDPMHANTFTSESGHKTRDFNDILKEITRFFEIHWAEGTIPGGVHLEMTGKNVTECVGGARNIVSEELHNRYDTTCDPRLNAEQSLEVAFQIADMIKH